ncbi:unnamed protein product [Caenorhabditis auriculariae]|uniref:Uncharacterized protein n=1 Tax=Caenorhabditis auriculariae TaxID=2777116 RepID=A0A8S1H2U8_9PELO|nr:unnamed protein product [Caenorhabditis auriculariae]
MIFEVPVDHFPMQQVRKPDLRLPSINVVAQSEQVSADIPPLSPSVRQSHFNFPTLNNRARLRAELPPTFKRTNSAPALHSQPVRRGSSPLSIRIFRNKSALDLLQLPFRILIAQSCFIAFLCFYAKVVSCRAHFAATSLQPLRIETLHA